MIVLISSSIAFALAALSPYRHSVAFLGLHAGEAPATSFARHGGAVRAPRAFQIFPYGSQAQFMGRCQQENSS